MSVISGFKKNKRLRRNVKEWFMGRQKLWITRRGVSPRVVRPCFLSAGWWHLLVWWQWPPPALPSLVWSCRLLGCSQGSPGWVAVLLHWWGLRLEKKLNSINNSILYISLTIAKLICEETAETLCGLFCTPTGCGWASSTADVHLPVVKGAAHNGVLPRLQHHITAYKLLDCPLAVGQQASKSHLVATAERGTKNHDAQVQQMAVGRVWTPVETERVEVGSGPNRPVG